MAALRSLDPEFEEQIAASRREFDRRARDNNLCMICGDPRETCRCKTAAELRDGLLHDDTWTGA